jgi:hypothetical protein
MAEFARIATQPHQRARQTEVAREGEGVPLQRGLELPIGENQASLKFESYVRRYCTYHYTSKVGKSDASCLICH